MRSGPCHLSVSGVMTDSLERYFIRRVRHAPAPQSMRPILATICLPPCCFLPVCQKAATARQTHCTCATLAESAICLPAKCRKKMIPYPTEVINLLRRVWVPFGCSWMLAGDSELIEQVSTEFFTR